MDNSILKDLYRGNLSPGEKTIVPGSEMARITKDLTETENLLTEKITPELQPIFTRLLSAQASLCRLTAEEYYIDGFRTGSRFILDILDDTHDNIRPE